MHMCDAHAICDYIVYAFCLPSIDSANICLSFSCKPFQMTSKSRSVFLEKPWFENYQAITYARSAVYSN